MSVPSVLGERLASARRAGETFEDAWPVALAAAVNTASLPEREEWQTVLTETVETWREGWERRPSRPCERALVEIAEAAPLRKAPCAARPALAKPAPKVERPCAYCGEEIPPQTTRRRRYCSDRCRRDAYEERKRVAA